LPSGSSLASFDLQVGRSDQAADVVPVAFFDPPATVSGLEAGQALLAIGRVRRRFFRVGGSTQSRTEVVAEHVVPMASVQEVRALLGRAAALVAGACSEAGEGPQA
jgi:single-strand DNA-binding protein